MTAVANMTTEDRAKMVGRGVKPITPTPITEAESVKFGEVKERMGRDLRMSPGTIESGGRSGTGSGERCEHGGHRQALRPSASIVPLIHFPSRDRIAPTQVATVAGSINKNSRCLPQENHRLIT